jgi:hypothetical protein
MSNDTNHQRPANRDPLGESIHYEPPGWLSTEELELELFLAVVGDSKVPQVEDKFQRIDAYFGADAPETELEYRRSLLRLLAGLRPQVAELIGGPGNLNSSPLLFTSGFDRHS